MLITATNIQVAIQLTGVFDQVYKCLKCMEKCRGFVSIIYSICLNTTWFNKCLQSFLQVFDASISSTRGILIVFGIAVRKLLN